MDKAGACQEGSFIIKEKANQLAREMGINSVASNGWFYRFKTRQGLTFKSINGEAGLVTPEILKEWKEKTLPDILARYSASDIYNVAFLINVFLTKRSLCQQKRFPEDERV